MIRILIATVLFTTPAFAADYVKTTTAVAVADQTLFRRTDGAMVRPDPADPNFAARSAWLAIQGNVPDEPTDAPLGVVVRSTSTPALNGNYDLNRLQDILTISVYALANNKFPANQTTLPWRDSYGFVHTFTLAQWKIFMSAMVDYFTAQKIGQNPTQPITIP